jgi:hypothetical protein
MPHGLDFAHISLSAALPIQFTWNPDEATTLRESTKGAGQYVPVRRPPMHPPALPASSLSVHRVGLAIAFLVSRSDGWMMMMLDSSVNVPERVALSGHNHMRFFLGALLRCCGLSLLAVAIRLLGQLCFCLLLLRLKFPREPDRDLRLQMLIKAIVAFLDVPDSCRAHMLAMPSTLLTSAGSKAWRSMYREETHQSPSKTQNSASPSHSKSTAGSPASTRSE